ncbi:MAG: hypothetical protein L6V86_05475 [Treponema sp.]|nr:MAG: hypothetical protein L6V86_05475 [Treponema sp.]
MKRLFAIITIFLIFGQSMFSEEKESSKYDDMSVSIKYYDRTMYYPGNPDTNPVFVHISIKNNSARTMRFKLADDRMFSVDFNGYTIKNLQIPQTENVIRKRTTNQTVYFREISLETGEEYSFVENLKDYIEISEPSVYYVELKFYPELYKSKYLSVTSNRLSLEIRPSPSAASSAVLPVKNKSAELLKPEEISPDKVVEQTIIARQKSLWDQYFLYLDIEAMLQRNAPAKRKYISSSAEERARMLKNYRADLMQSRIDNDIVAVPDKFEIERTVYSKTEGTVTVTEWFRYPNYHEKKSYVYKVRQREGIWQIYDYTVTNLGTE